MELILLLKEASSDSTELRSWFKDEGLIEELGKANNDDPVSREGNNDEKFKFIQNLKIVLSN